MHPEAVLLVDDGEAEVAKRDVLLEQRMGADDDVDRALGKAEEHAPALGALVAAGEQRDPQAGLAGERLDALEMLAGQDLGRRHQRRLAPGLDGARHGKERDRGLAGADVALEQAQHALVGGEVAPDLFEAPAPARR